jgi:DNA modification methylase
MQKISTKNADIYFGDCLDVLKNMDNESVDLIITSPPYANRRNHTYGGINPDIYAEWFVPRSFEFKRVLKPTGSFILNIKEHVSNCERHTYVLELILALKKQGWLWTEEYIWHKKNSYPGKWPNRFRNAWERVLHFTKQREFKMFQESVMIPVAESTTERLGRLKPKDMSKNYSETGSGFSGSMSNWLGREFVYPTNVLHLSVECGNKKHSAVFPESLPSWFIKLFSEQNDVVLDPFAGSGTTLFAANKLGRKAIGIDNFEPYIQLIYDRIKVFDT